MANVTYITDLEDYLRGDIIDLEEVSLYLATFDPEDETEDAIELVERVRADMDGAGYDDPMAIAEHYMEDYAQQLAEDIGAIDPNATWPITCINWAQATRELAMDYSMVEINGQDYYVR